jgi:hypothetical protein
MRPRLKRLILFAPVFLVGMLVFMAIGGGLVLWLWNWLLPPLFGWPQIGFWQALGLLALCRIFLGGSGWLGSGRSGIRRRIEERMAERMTERCDHMTPEERERFRQRMRERFGFDSSTGDSKEDLK